MQMQNFFNRCFRRLSGILFPTILLFCMPVPVSAQQERPQIGLVLSGGGAKGVAHIGVLKVLEEAGIPIDYISGTSMGAIVGGLYAVGYNAHELDSMVRRQDWIFLLTDQIQRPYRSYQSRMKHEKYLLSVPFSDSFEKKVKLPSGVMCGQSVLNKFSDLTIGFHQVTSFDSLPIPFACVAGDLVTGKEVVLKSGSLPLAMRASMAVPGVFSPVYQDSMALIDGGIFNNFPVDVALEMGADITIGVDLSTKGLDEPDYHSVMGIADRIAFLVGEEKKEKNQQRVDLYMNPKLKGYTSADFNASDIDTMIVMGERIARAHWDDIMALKARLSGYSVSPRKQIKSVKYTDTLHFAKVNVIGLQSYDEGWIKKMSGMKEQTSVTLPMLESYVKTLQGTGLFSEVTYQVIEESDSRKLNLLVKEKPEGSFNIGMHLDTEDIASILLHTQFKTGGRNGSEAFATARINRSPWLNLGYMLNTRNMKSLEFSYRIGYNDFSLLKEGDKTDDITFLYNHVEFNFREYFAREFTYRFGIQYDHFNNVSQLYTPDYAHSKGYSRGYASCFLNLSYDTFDNLNHPSKGISCSMRGTLYGDGIFSENSHAFGAVQLSAQAALPLSSRFCLLPEVSGRVLIGDDIPGFYLNYARGEFAGRYLPQQLAFYGTHHTELLDNSVLMFRLALRYKIAGKHYLSCIGNYAATENKLYRIWNKHGMWGTALKYSYDSLIGPLSITFDYSDHTDKLGIYANIGYYF